MPRKNDLYLRRIELKPRYLGIWFGQAFGLRVLKADFPWLYMVLLTFHLEYGLVVAKISPSSNSSWAEIIVSY